MILDINGDSLCCSSPTMLMMKEARITKSIKNNILIAKE
jgi:hypothetical protein